MYQKQGTEKPKIEPKKGQDNQYPALLRNALPH